ncbi:uncharacterized protein LOC111083094 [Limulus polyphemus]|uniref:Uncharacterized protein LOC111083094 n=1 Tax=Limulus polyphemus TaxID=6850 RepID=A0ABM1RUK2_LIMPO|nr:uncharacterized protein LOC111083094 [Limulus polyphemus]
MSALSGNRKIRRVGTQEETISSEVTNVYETSRQSCSKELNGPITKDLDCKTTINNDKLCESLEKDSANVNVDKEQPYSNGDVKLHVSPKETLKMKEFYLLSIVCICSYYPFMFVSVFYKTASFFLWPLVLHRITSSLGWFATFCVTATVSFIGILVTILFPETYHTQPSISSSFDGDK